MSQISSKHCLLCTKTSSNGTDASAMVVHEVAMPRRLPVNLVLVCHPLDAFKYNRLLEAWSFRGLWRTACAASLLENVGGNVWFQQCSRQIVKSPAELSWHIKSVAVLDFILPELGTDQKDWIMINNTWMLYSCISFFLLSSLSNDTILDTRILKIRSGLISE